MRTKFSPGIAVVCLALVLASFAATPVSAEPVAPEPEPTVEPLPTFTMVTPPKVTGTIRYGKTLTRSVGTYSETEGLSSHTQWLRNNKPITGANGRTYKLGVSDVGARISVRLTVRKAGFQNLTLDSAPTWPIRHVRDVRKTVNYRIAYRGTITANKSEFRTQVNQILNDPRGWRSTGIAFKEVQSGGSMTVYLANASSMTSFSSSCSSNWSCRVGRNVVINQERWKHSTSTWRKAKGTTLSGYRHMVVNHETGHWLGWKHRSCGGKGKRAPLMMQQSKGLKGCKPNPWPIKSERNPPRFR